MKNTSQQKIDWKEAFDAFNEGATKAIAAEKFSISYSQFS